jgi:hypothetical protein
VKWKLEKLPKPAKPEPDYDYELELFKNRTENYQAQQSKPEDPDEPVLESVPNILEDPLGWFQATLINAGRSNEEVKNTIVDAADAWQDYHEHVNQPLIDGAADIKRVINNTNTILKEISDKVVKESVSILDRLKQEVAAPIITGLAEVFDRASTGARGLLNLSAYGLQRAAQGAEGIVNLGVYGLNQSSQSAQGLIDIVDPIPAILRNSKPTEKKPVGNSANVTVQLGFTEDELKQFAQEQPDGDTCAVTSAAMAINMLYGTNISVEGMEKYLHESPLHMYKLPWFGPFPADQKNALDYLFTASGAPFSAEYSTNGTHNDLIDNLNNGNITIVNTSHGSNFWTLPPYNGVGHAMVLVGHDANTDEYLFLDPGNKGVVTRINAPEFLDTWLNQPNPIIPSGTMITIEPDP